MHRICRATMAVAFVLPSIALSQPSGVRTPATLFYGAAVGANVGVAASRGASGLWGDLQILSIGWGRTSGDKGFLIVTRLAEIAPSGENGDFMFAAGTMPIYVYALRGPVGHGPFVAGFIGGCMSASYDMRYLQAGVSVKAGPQGEAQLRAVWRGQWYGSRGPARRDFFSIGVGLELGGIWLKEDKP